MDCKRISFILSILLCSKCACFTIQNCAFQRNHALLFKRQSFMIRFESLTNDLYPVSSPHLKEEHLLNLIQIYKESKSNSPPPSKDFFIDLIDNWLSIQQPDRAESILDKMEELYEPSGRIFERIINNWSYISIECSNRARLLTNIDDEENAMTFTSLKETAVSAANHALKLLSRMEELYKEEGGDFRPALSTYTSTINALRRSAQEKSYSETIERLLEMRDTLYNDETQKIQIRSARDVFCLLSLRYDEGVMRNMSKDKRNIPLGNTRNFNLVINELAKTGKSWAAQAAEDVLDFMIERCKTNVRLTPTTATLNGCINAWANVGNDSSATRAEAVLEKLNILQTSRGLLTDIVPDSVSYNTLIKAYAKAGNAAQAEATLHTMEQISRRTGDSQIKPDAVSYSSVLHAYAQAAPKNPGACIKAEKILMDMIESQKTLVTTIHFNTVLNAHATLGSGRRAAMLLKVMEDMTGQNSKIRPDLFTYNTVLKALANSKEKGSVERAKEIIESMERDGNVKPNSISYNTLILVYANHGAQGGVAKFVRGILKKMETKFLNGDASVKPTSFTYTTVIKACSWEKEDSTLHAEKILESLIKTSQEDSRFTSPDTPIYNALLHCWARSGSRDATQRAEEILHSMLLMHQETGDISVKPNVRTYTTIIDILAKGKEKGNTDKAIKILDEMERLYESGDNHARPNALTYTAAINCIAKSKDPDKAIKAVSMLERMEEQYRKGNHSARPNIVAYNAVLNACAYAVGDSASIETAFKLACVVFDDIRTSDYLVPTHVTYGTFLSICANLMPESEVTDSLVEATFKRCARDGLVSNMVWKNLMAAASSRLLDKFSNENSEPSWSRNV